MQKHIPDLAEFVERLRHIIGDRPRQSEGGEKDLEPLNSIPDPGCLGCLEMAEDDSSSILGGRVLEYAVSDLESADLFDRMGARVMHQEVRHELADESLQVGPQSHSCLPVYR